MTSKDIFFAFGFSAILAISYTFFHYAKFYNDTFEISVIACGDNINDNSLSLYYDTGKGYSETDKITFKKNKSQYVAKINLTSKRFLKTVRLDFDEVDSFCLQQLTLYDEEHKIIYALKAKEIEDNIIFLSDGILNIKEKRDSIVIETSRLDPYIIFKSNFFISSNEI